MIFYFWFTFMVIFANDESLVNFLKKSENEKGSSVSG